MKPLIIGQIYVLYQIEHRSYSDSRATLHFLWHDLIISGRLHVLSMTDLSPLLSEERADDPEGLWATKQYGDFKVCRRWCSQGYIYRQTEARVVRMRI